MPTDLTAFFLQELAAHQVHVVDQSGADLQAYCFRGHDHATPSLSIRRLDGAFYCFGCGVRGRSWNRLADLIGAKQLAEAELPDPDEVAVQQLSRQVAAAVQEMDLPWGLLPWQGDWRGMSEKFLLRCGAHQWFDPASRCSRIFFPCFQNQETLGWVARRLDQDDKKKYRNAPGMNSTEVLFPFDTMVQLLPRTLRHTETVVLVEGPVDALRLLACKIPAVAVLGTNNFRPHKRVPLLSLGAKRVIVAMDSDRGGKQARQEITPVLAELFDVEQFYPPYREDPGSMNHGAVERLRRLLFSGCTER
jgi:DNA primase